MLRAVKAALLRVAAPVNAGHDGPVFEPLHPAAAEPMELPGPLPESDLPEPDPDPDPEPQDHGSSEPEDGEAGHVAEAPVVVVVHPLGVGHGGDSGLLETDEVVSRVVLGGFSVVAHGPTGHPSPVSFGQIVVEMAMTEVTTLVCVWLSRCSGQLVTSGAQDVTVTSVVVYTVEVVQAVGVEVWVVHVSKPDKIGDVLCAENTRRDKVSLSARRAKVILSARRAKVKSPV